MREAEPPAKSRGTVPVGRSGELGGGVIPAFPKDESFLSIFVQKSGIRVHFLVFVLGSGLALRGRVNVTDGSCVYDRQTWRQILISSSSALPRLTGEKEEEAGMDT